VDLEDLEKVAAVVASVDSVRDLEAAVLEDLAKEVVAAVVWFCVLIE